MTDRLYDALEVCLRAMGDGQTIDSALMLYPELESELRPILEASLQARSLTISAIPEAVQRRGRERLIHYAADLRRSRTASSTKRKISLFPRLGLVFGLTSAFILSCTGLVSASSNSLPGDQLYSVKRTWEGVQLTLVPDPQARQNLQSRFNQERLNEIDELLVQNRSQPVTFSGLVIKHQDGTWLISGIPVQVTDKTLLTSSLISDNVPVTVMGTTRTDGVLEAEEIQSLHSGSMLPPLEPSDVRKNNDGHPQPVATIAPMETESHGVAQTPVAPAATPQSFSYTGVVQGENGKVWTINGQKVSVDQAVVNGNINLGEMVHLNGYYSEDGKFVVTNIESESHRASSPKGGNNGSSGSSGSGSNGGNQGGNGGNGGSGSGGGGWGGGSGGGEGGGDDH